MKHKLLFILLALMPIVSFAQSEVTEKQSTSGWHGSIETGYSSKDIKMHLILSYPIQPTFSVGLGSGINWGSGIPLFANLKVVFLDKAVAPFASFNAGCTLGIDDTKTGTLLNTMIGIRIKRSARTAFFLGVGCDVLTVSSNRWDFGSGINRVENRENVGVFAINMGVDF
jgi:hypothetical protein